MKGVSFGSNVEATKTEPDKNTYLVLHDLKGADRTPLTLTLPFQGGGKGWLLGPALLPAVDFRPPRSTRG